MFEISNQIRETRLSPRRAPRRSLLPLSPKRTQVRLKSLLYLVWLTPDSFPNPTGVLRSKSTVCGLNGLRPASTRGSPPFKSSTATRSCSCGLFPWVASLTPKKYGTPNFSVRNRTSKYSRSCSQSLAELLRLRKAGTLRFIRAIRRGASEAVSWERFTCRRVAPAFWFS